MSKSYSRRDFLKLASVGAATTAVLTGCGPASRYVTREPYTRMPEYTLNGFSTYFATTCRECAAGCGLIVRTHQGRAIKVEGNPAHPVNLGKTCARGQATLQGLYNPDRVTEPAQHARGSGEFSGMEWDAAIQVVADAFKNHAPEEIAFLTGMAPDHLFDLLTDLTSAIGAPAPVRYGALSLFDARATLMQAAQDLFGKPALPYFDIANADVTLSFGASFLETWLSPVSYTRGYARMRKGEGKRRGHLIHFEPRMSQTAAKADEWIPVAPGTEALVAAAIGRLAAQARGATIPAAFASVDVEAVATASGVSRAKLESIAAEFAGAEHPLAIAGGAALGHSNGVQTAKAVLAINALAGNLGQPGGVYLSPLSPLEQDYHRPASVREMSDFVARMSSGAVKVLFVHGVNPVFELPKSLGFEEALKSVPLVISFATFPDETAMQADYVFPDHHGLESWGYQRVATGAAQSTLSGAQPVIMPFVNTRSTVDVLLAAAAQVGGGFALALPFADEFAFVENKIGSLMGEANGNFSAPEINTFHAFFQQHGGWWANGDGLEAPPAADVSNASITATPADTHGEGEFFLHAFVSPILGESGANKPWLQELPDPTTTVMWNTWVEMNPETGHELGIEDDDVVRITSEAGEIEAPVYLYPAIRPDVIAVPFGQGHTAYGQFAAGRGVNPINLLSASFNEAGDLAFSGVKVKVEKTGRKQHLARLEGVLGVYGFENR